MQFSNGDGGMSITRKEYEDTNFVPSYLSNKPIR